MATESIHITQSLSPRTPGSSVLLDGLLDGSVTGQRCTDRKESVDVQRRRQATINILPDEALLEIFYFYREVRRLDRPVAWWWKNLTDVCRRWRDIIFASPRFLDVRLECTDRTPTRTSLDIWPPFPIAISYYPFPWVFDDDEAVDNIVAALAHHDRVIRIGIRAFSLQTFDAVMQKPFPLLTHLVLESRARDNTAPVLHEGFLGGSAPRLETFVLLDIPFPAFPRLALSATHLSYLMLLNIPIAGYISPEAMATCLATLPNLRELSFGFESPQSHPDRIGLPPPTRVVLPALTYFYFKGASKYLEDLVARIDAPKLVNLQIHLFVDLIFNIPHLYKFIVRAESIRPLTPAGIVFSSSVAEISLGPSIRTAMLGIICREPDLQASSMARLCNQLSPLLSHVELLNIRKDTHRQARQGNGMDPTQFLELFHPFPSIKYLHIYGELRPLVARALQELTGDGAAEVLPSLRSLVFEGPSPSGSIQKGIQGFITARQNSNHPVDVEWK